MKERNIQILTTSIAGKQAENSLSFVKLERVMALHSFLAFITFSNTPFRFFFFVVLPFVQTLMFSSASFDMPDKY